MMEGMMISNGVIGGIVGGLLFLFVAIVMAVMAIRIFAKRRQRERAMRYGMKTTYNSHVAYCKTGRELL